MASADVSSPTSFAVVLFYKYVQIAAPLPFIEFLQDLCGPSGLKLSGNCALNLKLWCQRRRQLRRLSLSREYGCVA
jgi:hypothetical protein